MPPGAPNLFRRGRHECLGRTGRSSCRRRLAPQPLPQATRTCERRGLHPKVSELSFSLNRICGTGERANGRIQTGQIILLRVSQK